MLGIFREKQHTSCVKCFENVKLKNPIGFLERRIEKNLIAPQARCLNKPFFRSWLNDFDFIKDNLEYIEGLFKLAVAEDNEDYFDQLLPETTNLLEISNKSRLENLMSESADPNNIFLEIHAGAGGTESQDWAEILQRMYFRWAESKKFKVILLQESRGDEAGIKSSTIKISGDFTYGWLKKESGIHRLVRISPFDSNKRRHTSFASVWVYPEIDDKIDIEINEVELRVDTYRASGAGGQHVNTTDSAVRITHQPTGIVVTSSEKSQHQNRDIAMKALKSRLYQLELNKRTAAISDAHESKGDAGWGNQIRSYVLHPYQMVKDLRSNIETSDTQGVLNGDLDNFMASALALNVAGKSRSEANKEN